MSANFTIQQAIASDAREIAIMVGELLAEMPTLVLKLLRVAPQQLHLECYRLISFD